ncbi:MFS general substrate transporter [Gyrodon lividus]|nr:MFS general substrate transporter [Gyrodon lividus]
MATMRSHSEDVEPAPPSKSELDTTLSLATQSITFPEGGLQAWLTVAGGFMVVFCTSGTMQTFGVYQDYYTRVSLTEYSTSDISWIGSVQTFFFFAGGLFSGKLFDDGWFRELLVFGSLLYIFSSFMLSLVEPHQLYQIILSQGFGMGIGMGILFLPVLSIQAHYFKRRRGLAMGIIMSGSSVGSVIYPIMMNHLFNGPIGFAWGVRIMSFIYLALLSTANLIMKTRLPPAKMDPNYVPVNMRAILTDVPFWVCLAGIASTFWGLFVPMFYIQLFVAEHHVSGIAETYVVAILNAAGFFGRTVPMFLSDMWGASNVIIPVTAISGALSFAMLGATSNGGAVGFAILFGFFSGGFVSLTAPASAAFSRNLGEVGTRIGVMTFVASFALLTGEPISGALLSPPGYTWTKPVIFSGVTMLVGSALLALARTLQMRHKPDS